MADYLGGYDPEIRTKQMKIDGVNRHGYEWDTFLKSFKTYITPKEVEEIERDLGLVASVAPTGKETEPKVAPVASVAPFHHSRAIAF